MTGISGHVTGKSGHVTGIMSHVASMQGLVISYNVINGVSNIAEQVRFTI